MTQMEVALACSTTALWIWIWMLERRLCEYFAPLEKEVEELQKLRKQLEKKQHHDNRRTESPPPGHL